MGVSLPGSPQIAARRGCWLRRLALAGPGRAARARRAGACASSPGAALAAVPAALELRRLQSRAPDTAGRSAGALPHLPHEQRGGRGPAHLGALAVSRAGLRRRRHPRAPGTVSLRIDPLRRRVRLAGGARLPYDRLVVAPGIRFLRASPEGMSAQSSLHMPHAWTAGEQTSGSRSSCAACADGGAVAISVPAGLMRCPPGPYERASLIAHCLKSRQRARCKVLLFDSNNSFPAPGRRSCAAWEQLYPG